MLLKPRSNNSAAFMVRSLAEGEPSTTVISRRPVMGRAGHDVEAGRADEPGLHAVRARIAADEAVVVADDAAAELDGADMEQILLLRELAQQRPGEDRHVARRGLLPLVGQTVRIDEMALAHAEALGGVVHHGGEAVDRAAEILGDGRGDVVRRLDHDDLSALSRRTWVPGLNAILEGGRAAASSVTVRS